MSDKTLRQQLDAWKAKQEPPKPPEPPRPFKLPNPLRGKQEHQIVAGGVIKWQPVDRAAINVFRKANWLELPPPEPPKPVPPPAPKPRKKKHNQGKSMSSDFPRVQKSTATLDGQVYFNRDEIIQDIINEINKQPTQITAFARAALDARTVAEENTQTLGRLIEDFNSKMKMALDDMRQSRFAVLSEMNTMGGAIREVRQFFLGPNYDLEIKRLKEFVDLCERLKALKESGFLDNIADTMLRLAK